MRTFWPQHVVCAWMAAVALILGAMPGCASRTPAPILIAGASPQLRAAHDALLRAQHSEASIYAPRELEVSRRSLTLALKRCAASNTGQKGASHSAYLVRLQAQLAQAVGGLRAAQQRSADLQLALTALQEAAASDAWDTGDAQEPLWRTMPSLACGEQLLGIAWGSAASSGVGQGHCPLHIDVSSLFDDFSSTLTARGAAFAAAVAASAASLPPGGAATTVRLHRGACASAGIAGARLSALAAYLRAGGAMVAQADDADVGHQGTVLWQVRADWRR